MTTADAMVASSPEAAIIQTKMDKSMSELHARMPSSEEADGFNARVDEVSMLIDGLSKGTISPEYIDSKLAAKAKKAEQAPKVAPEPAIEPQEKPKPTAQEAAKASEETMAKVAVIKASLERKKRARARYEDHTTQAAAPTNGTDYLKWDLWCPEDEEDELIASCTPENPQFKAMEKDIDTRHKKMLEQRQMAERCRVAGNEAYKAGQWTVAYGHYELGLVSQRTNVKLQSNAAMASLKMGCHVQAIEHCDRVIRLLDYLLDKPDDPLVTKALQRRATACSALRMYKEAVVDMEKAALRDPTDPELMAQLQTAQRELAEHKRLQQLKQLKGDGDSTETTLVQLQKLEASVKQLREATIAAGATEPQATAKPAAPQGLGASGLTPRSGAKAAQRKGAASDTQSAADAVGEQVAGNDDLRLFLRECRGVAALADALVRSAASDGVTAAAEVTALAGALNEACQNDSILHFVAGGAGAACADSKIRLKGASVTSVQVLDACATGLRGVTCSACVALLHTLATASGPRSAVVACLTKQADEAEPALGALFAALPGLPPAHQVIALSLVANCLTVPKCARALATLPHVCGTLAQTLAGSTNDVLTEGLATLLGNACTNADLRATLASEGQAMGALVRHAQRLCRSDHAQALAALQACLACISNFAVEDTAAKALMDGEWHLVAQQLLQHRDGVVVARTAATIARTSRLPGSFAASDKVAVLATLLCVAARAAPWEQAALGEQAPPVRSLPSDCALPEPAAMGADAGRHLTQESAWQVMDALARALAVWGREQVESRAQVLPLLQHGDVQQLLLHMCGSRACSDAGAGNAALCLSYLAADGSQIPRLRDRGAVQLLTRTAYDRKGTAASKNAAITLAKLACDGQCRDELRECHGFEIIHSYVKP